MLRNSENGLTLIELIVMFSVLGFIIAALYTFYFAGLNSWNRSNEHLEYQQTARIAMDKMIRELRFAHEVSYSLGESAPSNNADPANTSSEIFFRLHGEHQTLWDRFALSGRQIIFDQYFGTSINAYRVVALNITNLEFHIEPNNTVYILVTAGDDKNEFTLTGRVKPRNLDFGEE